MEAIRLSVIARMDLVKVVSRARPDRPVANDTVIRTPCVPVCAVVRTAAPDLPCEVVAPCNPEIRVPPLNNDAKRINIHPGNCEEGCPSNLTIDECVFGHEEVLQAWLDMTPSEFRLKASIPVDVLLGGMPGRGRGRRRQAPQRRRGRIRRGQGGVDGGMSTLNLRAFGFPDVYRCWMRYSDVYTFGSSATPAAQVWRANSLFDPDLTSGGHQPLYYDQLTAVYNEYLVFKFDISLELINQASSSVIAVLMFSDSNISANTVEELTEGRYSKHTSVGPGTGMGRAKLFGTMSMSKLHGQRNLDSDPNQYSAVGSNPTDVGYCIFKCASTDGTNVNLYVRAVLRFVVKFKDAYEPNESLANNQRTLRQQQPP